MKKLCCLMSFALALSVCMPGGLSAFAADDVAATAPEAPAATVGQGGEGAATDQAAEKAAATPEDEAPEVGISVSAGERAVPADDGKAKAADESGANATRAGPDVDSKAGPGEAAEASDAGEVDADNVTAAPDTAKAPAAPLLRGPKAPATPKAVDTTVSDLRIQRTDGSTPTSFYSYETFYLKMKWDASQNGANLHEGDYFDITLPDSMRFPSDTTARDFNLYVPGSTTVIATAHVNPGPGDNGGKVRVTFTDWVEGKEKVNGSIDLLSKFNREKIKEGEGNTFNVTVSGKVIPVTVKIDGAPNLDDDEVLAKWGAKVDGQDGQAQWWARLNYAKATLTNVTVSDQLTGGDGSEKYIEDSFVLYKVQFDPKGTVVGAPEPVSLDGKLAVAPDGRSFTLSLGDVNGDQYSLGYRTGYTPGTTLSNSMTLKSTEGETTKLAEYHVAESGGSGDGSLANKIKLIKVDADDNATPVAGAVFTVTAPDGSTFTLTTGADGTVMSGFLTSGTYKVREQAAPKGYELNGLEYTLTVSSEGGAVQTVTDEREKIDIPVTKSWVGPKGSAVTVKLMADGVDTGKDVTLNVDNNWTSSFEGMPKYTTAGDEIGYTVTEAEVSGVDADKYKTAVSGDAASGFTITNTNKETVNISGSKVWNDDGDRDGMRPESITVRLHADGTEKEARTVTAADGWEWSFDGLVKYDSTDGHEISYTVEEVDVPAGYESKVTGDAQKGFTIENSHQPAEGQPPAKTGKPTGSRMPRTGDDANLAGLAVAGAAALGVAIAARRRRS